MILYGRLLSIFLNIDLNLLTVITEKIGKNDWGALTLSRMSLIFWVIYYGVFLVIKFISTIMERKQVWSNLNKVEKIEIKLLRIIEDKKKILLKCAIYILALITMLNIYFLVVPENNIKINFVDVGQGDATLITTPWHKNILIDGGGSLDTESFDVGKNILIPYLLNKNIKKIDYIIVSHFDSDHVGGLLSVMEKLKVKNVIIAKQIENSENYEKFLKIVKEKKIKLIVVKKR